MKDYRAVMGAVFYSTALSRKGVWEALPHVAACVLKAVVGLVNVVKTSIQ